jgi:ankyrin repeat protein
VNQLVENADQTFLWVSVVLETLENSLRRSRGAIQDLISTLPKSIYGLYEKLLSRAPNRDDARKLLNIVLGATRPLSLEEINVAFTIKRGDHSFQDLDLEPLDTVEGTIKAICGLFLKVVERRVYLVHQTAKEFLLKREEDNGCLDLDTWKHSLDPTETHYILAEICISYLRFNEFREGSHGTFLKYASESWTIHFQHCQYRDEDLCHSAAYLYITGAESYTFRTWFERLLCWNDIYGRHRTPSGVTNLMVASYFGHKRLADFFVLDTIHIRAQDDEGRTPLHWAALGGHVEILEMLSEKGAKIEERDRSGRTAMHCAAMKGRTSAVRWFIQRKADYLQNDKDWNTPLKLAALNGHTESAILLLGNANTIYEDDTPSLHLAAMNGHVLVVEALLKRAAELKESSESNREGYMESRIAHTGSTALHVAALFGRIDVIELLLRLGAKVDTVDAQGNTAFHYMKMLPRYL